MTPDTWMQTGDGRAVNLAGPPVPGTISLDAIVFAAAQVNRWCGQTFAGPVSIAQHQVWGCDAILEETGDVIAAAYFLVHDDHETIMGDWTTPAVAAVAARCDAISPGSGAVFRSAVKGMKSDLDREIFRFLGLPYPMPPGVAATVKDYDLRMLQTERRRFLDRPGDPRLRWCTDGNPPRQVRIPLKLLPRVVASEELRHRIMTVIPKAIVMLEQRVMS